MSTPSRLHDWPSGAADSSTAPQPSPNKMQVPACGEDAGVDKGHTVGVSKMWRQARVWLHCLLAKDIPTADNTAARHE
jgi:hypothetical protein